MGSGPEARIQRYALCVDSMLDRVIAKRCEGGALQRADVEEAQQKSFRPRLSGGSPGKRRSVSSRDETRRLDLLELFMDVQPPLSDVELRDWCKNMLVGGRDTTAVTLIWAFSEISRHPDVEAKLQVEADSVP